MTSGTPHDAPPPNGQPDQLPPDGSPEATPPDHRPLFASVKFEPVGRARRFLLEGVAFDPPPAAG